MRDSEKDDLDQIAKRLSLEDARLPGKGPSVDHDLLRRVVNDDPELPQSLVTTVFRLIAAYQSWDRAYLDILMKSHKNKK